jgi:adenylate cyclase
MPLARERRKLAAIVAADVVGYSRLMGRDESGTLARLRKNRSERLDPVMAKYGGRLVKLTGDGALIEFASPVDALSASIEFQQTMVEANSDQPADTGLVFRMGVHLGDLIVEGDDIYGDAVNVAARLEAEAPAGGILVSRAVREAVTGRLKVSLHALGEIALKNIERPIRAFRAEWTAEDWPAHSVAAGPAASPNEPAPVLTLPDKPSIAVLPFQNMSGDPEQEYFVDGLVEDIITALSRFPLFFVIARNSSFAYKGKSPDIRQVSRELGVRYVLEGSVRKAGNRLRITGQLVDTSSGNHLWADRFDGALEDVFDFQDKVTTSVVTVIQPMVRQAEIARVQAKATESLSAYDLFLRATALMSEFREESHDRARAMLERAIAIDPGYSTAYSLLGNLHLHRTRRNWGSFEEARALSLEAAKMAAETGWDNPTALGEAGFCITRLGEKPEEGLAYLERALMLNPNSTVTMRLIGWAYWTTGDHEKAIAHFEKAIRLGAMDPHRFLADAYAGIAHPCFFSGRYDQALAWLDKALPTRANHMPTLFRRIACLAALRRPAGELMQALEQLRGKSPSASIADAVRLLGMARPADRERYAEMLLRAGLAE